MNHSRPSIGNGARSSCADPLGDPPGLVDVDDRVEEDPELVAAEAGDRVARPERRRAGAGRPRASSRSPTAWPRLSLMTLNRSRSSRITATGSRVGRAGPSGRGAIRSVSSSRFGRPVVGSWRAPRCAASNSRALSRAIEASWAKRVRACDLARCRTSRSVVPDGEAEDARPPSRPRSAARRRPTRTSAVGRSGERSREGVVVVDRERRAASRKTGRRGPRRSASCAR